MGPAWLTLLLISYPSTSFPIYSLPHPCHVFICPLLVTLIERPSLYDFVFCEPPCPISSMFCVPVVNESHSFLIDSHYSQSCEDFFCHSVIWNRNELMKTMGCNWMLLLFTDYQHDGLFAEACLCFYSSF